MSLLYQLQQYIDLRIKEFGIIPTQRRAELMQLAQFVAECLAAARAVDIVFVCTHNSRRSQFAQVWARAASIHYSIDQVRVFSGGTEVTACDLRTVAALRRAGMVIEVVDPHVPNPIYRISMTHAGAGDVCCFSKLVGQPPNPTQGFCAVMTCSQADEMCPIVAGCEARVTIAYDDPKLSDNTDFESEVYDERCRQIAREMLFAFAHVDQILALKNR
ncbi:MAG TPA: protein-tyrosine-phosphatase [Pirellulaceae bacterium]|nr:protein-tyrosine-phosphatase [Pirellulaceae bacterium]HMO91603.1 protein-tyrosine-phosphatase [Pirellulaceae bacterium]HMP68300.1 protein-tyrosine-phosphatase [Pirellulaceae bacterium]